MTGGPTNAVTYGYDADGNRDSLVYPNNAFSFAYTYTGRNQLKSVRNTAISSPTATYGYNVNGSLLSRALNNGTSSSYGYDALGRVEDISHFLSGETRTFDYDYDSVGRRKWAKRDNARGDVFGYDLNDQVTATKLNITSPATTGPGTPTISYDANGNRATFAAYGATDTYTTNNLSQYTSRDGVNAIYGPKGNLGSFGAGTNYIYDSQNRLTSATDSGNTFTFKYDGLNRQVSRKLNGGAPVYSVWDGWELLEEVQNNIVTAAYLSGATGLIKDLISNNYYYQDGSGSTSHLADNNGTLLEWYRYDLQGTPIVYGPANVLRTGGSSYAIRHLFTGQQWIKELGLYDLRNRFYSPDLGRFLQPDPIGFAGDPSNLYRYCGGDPVNWVDPFGEDADVQGNVQGGAVTIRTSINFGGNASTVGGSWANWASARLTSTFGPYQVTTQITTGGYFSSTNTFRFQYYGPGGYTRGYQGFSVTEAFAHPQGGLGRDGQNAFLHELLHLLGAKDHYDLATGKPEKGWENNIMGGGTQINSGNIKEIIQNGGIGQVGGLVPMQFVPSVQAGVAGALSALNAYASGKGPGIGMITVSSSSGAQVYFVGLGWSLSTSGMWAPSGMWGLSGFAATFGHAGGAPPSAGLHPDEQYYQLN